MSAALAASTSTLHQHPAPSTKSPAKKTLRASLQNTLRSAAEHVHVRSPYRERDDGNPEDAAGRDASRLRAGSATGAPTPKSASTNSTTPKTTRTALMNTYDKSASSSPTNRQTSPPPRPPSRSTTASPTPSQSSTIEEYSETTRGRRFMSGSKDGEKTARGGGFMKLLGGSKPRLASVASRAGLAPDQSKKDDKTFRAKAGFQAPTLRAGTLSDPALHTLVRREKHQPLLSLAAAFDPRPQLSSSTSSPSAARSASKPTLSSAAKTRPDVRTQHPNASTTSLATQHTNESTTSLAPSTRERSVSRSSSRPPVSGPRGGGASASPPTIRGQVPSSPSKLLTKRPPPVSGIGRSRLTSPSTPSLSTPEATSPSRAETPSTRERSSSRAGAASPVPPAIQQRSSLRTSAPGGASPASNADVGKSRRVDDATVRRRSSSISPTVPTSESHRATKPSTDSNTPTRRPTLTSASTSDLPLSSSPSSPPSSASKALLASAAKASGSSSAGLRRSISPVPTSASPPSPSPLSTRRRVTGEAPSQPNLGTPPRPARRSSVTQAQPPKLTGKDSPAPERSPPSPSSSLIRQATIFILGECSSPPRELLALDLPLLGREWMKELEGRTKRLATLARKWSFDDRGAKTGDEEEEVERRAFCEALRDGYVLCQLLNKWSPNAVSGIDHREDGITKSNNITNFTRCARAFLDRTTPSRRNAANTSTIMFSQEDFLACTPASMDRVANVLLALQRVVESDEFRMKADSGGRSANSTPSPPLPTPAPAARSQARQAPSARRGSIEASAEPKSTVPTTTGTSLWVDSGNTQVWAGSAAQRAGVRGLGTARKSTEGNGWASASTPNLALPPTSPSSPVSKQKRDSGGKAPPSPTPQVPIPILTGRRGSVGAGGLPPLKTSASLAMAPSSSSPAPSATAKAVGAPSSSVNVPTPAPPPRKHTSMPPPSPSALFAPPPARAPVSRTPLTPLATNRSSVASNSTATTASSTTDSLFDTSHLNGIGGRYDKFGSIRTNATGYTSVTVPSSGGVPSLSRSEAREAIKEMETAEEFAASANDSSDTIHSLSISAPPVVPPSSGRRDRRSSDLASDLKRVVEEDEASGLGGARRPPRPLAVNTSASGLLGLQRPSLGGHANSSPSALRGKADYEDVFTVDEELDISPLQSDDRRARGSSPSYFVRRGSHSRTALGDDRDASPSPVRIASSTGNNSSGLSSSPSRRHSGRLVPKGSTASARTRASGDLALGGNHSTSSLVESPIATSPLAPAASLANGPNPIPFPRRMSNDGRGAGPALARNYSLSSSPSTPAAQKASNPASSSAAATPRPIVPRSRILSDSTGINGEASQRLHLDRVISDSVHDLNGGRRGRFESMVDVSTTASTGPPASLRRTLVSKEPGRPAVQYQLGNCIGRGQFGSVYRALNTTTGQVVAVKQIGLQGLPENEVTQLMREVELLQRLDHPSIVKYEGMSRDADFLSIVLEYAENGSLGQTLRAFGRLNEKLVAGYVAKILEGLNYLHQSQVVHCDLKAANILTTKTGNIKLSDFGVSLNLRTMENIKNDVAGTPNWMAPEVIELKGASTASDIWSLGCTIVELLTGKPPYGDNPNGLSVMFHIVEDPSPPLPKNISEALLDFLRQCFNKDPTKRPSAEALFEHEWLKNSWVELKDLRPQDSIPFLRRVSTDLQSRQLLAHQISFSQPAPSPVAAETSAERPEFDPVPRDHNFVKTSFSQAVDCRVCWTSVRKSAVFCQSCALVCHSRCVVDAPAICDMQQQLRTYAEHMQQRASSLPPATPEPRGRKISTTKRIPILHTNSSPASSSVAAASPPTSFPHQVMNSWKRNRNSVSSVASSDIAAVSPTNSPRTSREHEREASNASSNATHRGGAVGSLRSDGTASSSQDSSSGFYSSSDGSQGSRNTTSGIRGPLPTSNYVPSGLSSSSNTTSPTPTNVLTPVAEVPSPPPDTQAERPKRKQKGAESNSSCIMQ